MEDYPSNLREFEARFSSEDACLDYLVALRWPEGFRCPACGSAKAWRRRRRRIFLCASCGKSTSTTSGTIFQDSHIPLEVWFRAAWQVVSQKNGISASGLLRILGFGSYETAWACLQKLRKAMVRPGRDRLSGTVEVDEAFIGGLEEGKGGREPGRKALVAVAAQHDGTAIGRIRLARIASASAAELHRFVGENVAEGSVVRTDGWGGYGGLDAKGYRHEPEVLRGKGRGAATKLLPRVHRVISLLKRWLLGTHQGAVSPEHLDAYLDEFCFRFNRRTSASRGKLFYRLLQQAVRVEACPYDELIDPPAYR